jgi:hypothetical protein
MVILLWRTSVKRLEEGMSSSRAMQLQISVEDATGGFQGPITHFLALRSLLFTKKDGSI